MDSHVPEHAHDTRHGLRGQVLVGGLADGGLGRLDGGREGAGGHGLVHEGLIQPHLVHRGGCVLLVAPQVVLAGGVPQLEVAAAGFHPPPPLCLLNKHPVAS